MKNLKLPSAVYLFIHCLFSFHQVSPAVELSALDQLEFENFGAFAQERFPLFEIPDHLDARNVTSEYNSFFENADTSFNAGALSRLRNYKVLFVPGFLSDVSADRPYFDEQLNWLGSLGVDCAKVRVRSQSSIQVNAAIVSAAIEVSEKPVIFISHSKGGLDILDALLSDTRLAAKVRGIVPFQSPFFGSPVADFVASDSAYSSIAGRILNELGGDSGLMVNLTVAERSIYMSRNAGAIARIARAVPVIAVATFKDPVGTSWDTPFKPLRDKMLEQGVHSDGVVPVDSAVLPGADYVKLSGLDHSSTVRESSTPFNRLRAAKALLLMILSRQ